MSEKLKERVSLDEYELVAVPIEEYKHLKETERKYEELRETILQFFKSNNADLKEQIKDASQQTSLRDEIARMGNKRVMEDMNYINTTLEEIIRHNGHSAIGDMAIGHPFGIVNFF